VSQDRRLAPDEVAPAGHLTIRVGGVDGDTKMELAPPDAFWPRIDLVCVSPTGVTVIPGTPGRPPLRPADPVGLRPVALVHVLPGMLAVREASITRLPGPGLAEFLSARLDEDWVSPTPGRRALDDLRFGLRGYDRYEEHLSSRIEDGLDAQTTVWETRVRREVAAKRVILAQHTPDEYGCQVCEGDTVCPLLHLAAVYADHPDYRAEWKP
jgi:hypothetical protein